jgi:hypothetical protein
MIGRPTKRYTARNVPVGRVSARMVIAIAWTSKIAPMIAVGTVAVRRTAGSASMRAAWALRRVLCCSKKFRTSQLRERRT